MAQPQEALCLDVPSSRGAHAQVPSCGELYWGPACDSSDCSELSDGDWAVLRGVGVAVPPLGHVKHTRVRLDGVSSTGRSTRDRQEPSEFVYETPEERQA